METDPRTEAHAEETCPFCAFWTAYKHSEAAKHVAGIQRESLLLVRSMLDSCIKAMEDQVSADDTTARPAPGCPPHTPHSHP